MRPEHFKGSWVVQRKELTQNFGKKQKNLKTLHFFLKSFTSFLNSVTQGSQMDYDYNPRTHEIKVGLQP